MKNRKQLQVTLGVAVIVCILAYMVIDATRSNAMRYLEVKQVAAEAASLEGKQIRMRGRVKNGTIQKDRQALEVKFTIQDDKGDAAYPVRYKGIVPDTFKNGSEVVIDGTFHQNGSFEATQLQAKCPSKYEMQDQAPQGQTPKDHVNATAAKSAGY